MNHALILMMRGNNKFNQKALYNQEPKVFQLKDDYITVGSSGGLSTVDQRLQMVESLLNGGNQRVFPISGSIPNPSPIPIALDQLQVVGVTDSISQHSVHNLTGKRVRIEGEESSNRNSLNMQIGHEVIIDQNQQPIMESSD